MIYDNSNNLIKTSIKEYKTMKSKQRRKVIYKMIDYYQGDNTMQYIKNYFNAKAFKEVPLVSFNITKRFINKMSRIYTLGANRTLSGKQSQYDEMAHLKDYKMKHIEKMTKLLGSLAVQVSWGDDGKFQYTPIYTFDVHTDPLNPLKPVAIQYPMLLNSDDPASVETPKFCYWDSEQILHIDEDGKVIKEEENPYGFIPFVFFHKDHLMDSPYCYPALDITSCNEMLNILYTELNLGARFQSFGQYVVTGLYQDEKIKRVGSDEIIILPEGATLDIKSPASNIKDALTLARNMLEIVAQNNHLSISFADTNKDRPSSGIALKIKDLEAHEDYQDDLDIWLDYENKLYTMETMIADYNGVKLPSTIGIDFNEPEYPNTIPDQLALDTWMLENDLTTKPKLLKRFNDDLTIEQAKKIVDENKEINGQGKQEGTQGAFSRLRRGTPATE